MDRAMFREPTVSSLDLLLYKVRSMFILCLWDIQQLTFDWPGIETCGTYPLKYELKHCKGVQNFF